MNSDKILQDIMDLSRRGGVTNSQFRKEVESMVSLALHGKNIGGMSRKDRVKVMNNSTSRLDEMTHPTERLDEYLKEQKKQHKLDEGQGGQGKGF